MRFFKDLMVFVWILIIFGLIAIAIDISRLIEHFSKQ